MQSITILLDITKIADFQWRNAGVSGMQGLRHLI